MKRYNKFLFIASIFVLTLSSCKQDINYSSSIFDSMVNNSIDSIDSSEVSIDQSSDSSIGSSSEELVFEKPVNIYINPSVQVNNLYVNSLGNEAEHMNDIAKLMVDQLKAFNFLNVNYNLSYLSLANSVKESNNLNTDIHFSLHSNAGGGRGSEIYTIASDDDFAQHIYNDYTSQIGDLKKRGVKYTTSLYEIKNVKAKDRVLLELLFHDNVEEANFIVNNKEKISKILVNSICDYVKKFYFNIY